MTASAVTARFDNLINMATSQATAKQASPGMIKAREQAQDFEAMFLNSMFQHMLTGVDGDGPFGAGAGTGVWRSFLTSEYAKSIAQKGGIGIADKVMSSLIAQQAANSSIAPAGVQKGSY